MIRTREIRIAVTGALLFFAVGTLQACAADAIASPDAPATAHTVTTDSTAGGALDCRWIDGTLVCR